MTSMILREILEFILTSTHRTLFVSQRIRKMLSSLPDEPADESDVKYEPDLKGWCQLIDNIEIQLDHITTPSMELYIERVFRKYASGGREVDITEEVDVLSRLEKDITDCQDHILQLAGVGVEWNMSEKVAIRVHTVIRWLEDMLCHAMVNSQDLIDAHKAKELMYQQ
ncbi:hypothetical protein C0991_011014 [Blastosporella zonata]|nr:hypothetical protein C0991_011014 [Blastosporella zonata]